MKRRGWLLRGLALFVTFTLGLVAFRVGVGVTERDVQAAGAAAQVYYVFALFVLGGIDLGTPVGGPEWARGMLWFAYFAAPLITTGAVAEGFVRVLEPGWYVRHRLRGHVVIVGAGRAGLLFLEALSERTTRRFLLVDRAGREPLASELRQRHDALLLTADVRKPGTLLGLGLSRAAGVALVTGDDMVNLESASRIHEAYPELPVLAHVADLDLRRQLDSLTGRARTFNTHRLAARHLFETSLHAHLESTEAKDVVVIAGFGRFGQTILEELQSDPSASEIREVIVVDHDATRKTRNFVGHVGDRLPVRHTVDGDLGDPRTWETVRERVSEKAPCAPPFYLIGTDDPTLNLRVAMALRKGEGDEPRIVARTFSSSPFTDAVSEEFGIDVLSVERLLREAIAEHAPRWFPPLR